MNRRVGKAAILKEQQRRAMLAERGAKLNAEKLEQLRSQMRLFETHLREFALNHKESIQNDPAFRAQFHKMCASIGVDPLTSRKGMWSDLLGVGDYYYELAVRTIEVCVATRHFNGGVLALDELLRSLRKKRAVYAERISEDDVERAVSKLEVLGGGYKIVYTGKGKVITSVPIELTMDHTKVLDECSAKGYTTVSELKKSLGWTCARIENVLDFLLQKEIAWVDLQSAEKSYWILGLLTGSSSQS